MTNLLNKSQKISNAKKFKELHRNDRGLFLLPNAWNGGSAKVFAKQNFSAIGTTSAGIAYSLGYSDGENIQFSDIIRVTKEIVNVVQNVPLTVDVERGYSGTESLSEVVDNVGKLIDIGAVGVNIEDGLPDTFSVDNQDRFCEKIAKVAELKKQLEIPFVINARTDIYLLQVFSHRDELFNRTVERAKALKDCGADCIFIPGALDKDTIVNLRASIELPINLFVHPQFYDVKELDKIGINRLSSGSAPVRTVFNQLKTVSDEFSKLNCNEMLNHPFNYAAANEYFQNC
ncbi:isocitrate lyase/phosphoenolpyruvate mutase family protein [Lentisphaerota bacterium WC36G]|nr:isocitrate lyase/phosphoenolpyruvate mutase family protein [Lentisphaerae bacterium WC36]